MSKIFGLDPWYDGQPLDQKAIRFASIDYKPYSLHRIKLAIGDTRTRLPSRVFNLEDFITRLSDTPLFQEITPGHYFYYKGVRFSNYHIPYGIGQTSFLFMIKTRQEYTVTTGNLYSSIQNAILVPSKLYDDPQFLESFKAIGLNAYPMDYALLTENYNNEQLHAAYQKQEA